MKLHHHLATVLALLLAAVNASAQQRAAHSALDQGDAAPRFELGALFSEIHLPHNNHLGLGGRAVFNLNRFFALEGEGNFFLTNATPSFRNGGHATEGLFGVKTGIRNDAVGIFAKARPGFISFSRALQDVTFSPSTPLPFSVPTGRLTEPVLDIGAVIEFYPAEHWAWRTDLGDTMIFYRSSSFLGFNIPGKTQHGFQFGTGLQYRF
jgi:hypothetical protein